MIQTVKQLTCHITVEKVNVGGDQCAVSSGGAVMGYYLVRRSAAINHLQHTTNLLRNAAAFDRQQRAFKCG
jgi:hypothetical protein